ncbi:MAG: hypothetical protein HY270_12730 [Deltaproteobacteria bacterium]|nr:hypothetical protein [Deltaproteobacteria bacterium]
MNRRDMFFATLALWIAASLPFVYGYLDCPSNRWFSGIVYNVHDTAQYLTWMRESATHVLISNKLTAEPNARLFFNLHWWIPGRTAAWLGWSLPTTYQVFRLLAVPLYVAVVFWVCSLFFNDRSRVRLAFWLTTLGSGLGWVWVVEKYLHHRTDALFPLDIYTTPGNSFWVLIASPHLTLALALTILAFGLSWVAQQRRSLGIAAAAGGVTLFLGFGHVYDLVTIWSVLGLYGLLLTWRDGFRALTFVSLFEVVLLSTPGPLYFGWLSSSANPHWHAALAQFGNLGVWTPPPQHLVLLLGLPVVFALVAILAKARFGERRWTDRDIFLGAWITANLLLVYLPVEFQIMLLTGIQLPMAILTTDLIYDSVLPKLSRSMARWVPIGVLLLVLPTNAYLFAWRFVDLRRHTYPFYLHADDMTVVRWLAGHAGDAVVLSSMTIGHYLPGLSGVRVYLGSAVYTLQASVKRANVQKFFGTEMDDDQRLALLREAGIDYVYAGPAESALGNADLRRLPYLRPVVVTSEVTLYQVVSNASS